MSALSKWLYRRRQKQLDRFVKSIQDSSPERKKEFLDESIRTAYYPLLLAMMALKAPNFIEGDILEETNGERYHLEFKKVKDKEGEA